MANLPVSNDHNVYILGAGFSYAAGLPLMSGFLNRMRDTLERYQKDSRTREAEAIGRVLEYRLNAASAAYWATLDLENIEQLFSLATAARDPVSRDLPIAMAATLEFSRKHGVDGKIRTQPHQNETAQKYRPTKDNPNQKWADNAPRIYRLLEGADREGQTTFNVAALLGMINSIGTPSGTNTFITFNYDTLLEDAITRLEVPWTYGFRSSDAVTFRRKDKGKAGASIEQNTIPVLKLHGSLNWGQTGKGRKQKLTIFPSYIDLEQAGTIPRLIPPTWSKNVDDQLSTVWENAVERLSTATRIVIIGFSMPETDLHFRYLLAAGLQKNAWLRNIVFVNPDADGTQKRARAVLRTGYIDQGMIRFANMTSDAFAGALAGSHGAFGGTPPIDIGRSPEAQLGIWTTRISQ